MKEKNGIHYNYALLDCHCMTVLTKLFLFYGILFKKKKKKGKLIINSFIVFKHFMSEFCFLQERRKTFLLQK